MKKYNLESDHSFDSTYQEKTEMFGHPYQELQDFFKNNPVKGKLLDLGCGQGRDAIFLASLGYEVTAVDTSKVGIDQMIDLAKEKDVKVNGIVGDVLKIDLVQKFDVVLFDILLHSFKRQQQKELLEKYFKVLNKNGIMCIVFPDDMKTEYFIGFLSSQKQKWNLIKEIIIKDVPKMDNEDDDYTFMMIVVQIS